MREIKFRAWEPIGKKMYEVQSIDFFWGLLEVQWWELNRDLETHRNMKLNFKGEVGGTDEELAEFIYPVIMQFIGRCDKNSNEIYEGDIISAYNGRIKGPVIFDKRGLAFGIPNGPNEIYKFSMNFLESKDIEIIGNIYENPELLESEPA